jgi:hypothetical protein
VVLTGRTSYAPTSDVLHAYKMGVDGSGKPFFTEAGKSGLVLAGKGVPTVTSLNGQPGTGLVSFFEPLPCHSTRTTGGHGARLTTLAGLGRRCQQRAHSVQCRAVGRHVGADPAAGYRPPD